MSSIGPEQTAQTINPELISSNKDSVVRVYPVGFTPDIKRQLLDRPEARQIIVDQSLREVREAIAGASIRYGIGKLEMHEFLDQIRMIDDAIQNGAEATQIEKDFVTHALRTDEEIAVALGRVSRSSGSIEDNMRSVSEEGAAKFHGKWTVSIEGYGHASLAEHAILHLAVEGIPSLDGDILTDNRLASPTEFSARFTGIQTMEWYTPDSVAANTNLNEKWQQVHRMLFALNRRLQEMGIAYIKSDEARTKYPNRKTTTKVSADQFKNLMPASRLTSIGITMNAREAENIIRKMLSDPRPSVVRLGYLIKEAATQVAPTLVKYADRNDYLVLTREGIGKMLEDRRYQGEMPTYEVGSSKPAVLVDYDKRAEAKILAAAQYHDPRTGSYQDMVSKLHRLTDNEKRRELDKVFGEHLGKFDVPVRALEWADYEVEYPGMTYGDWRDYKRHRMESYEAKDLDTRYGYLLPALAYEMDESNDPQFHGCVEAMSRAMAEVNKLFEEVNAVDPYAAQYAVTRFHLRPAIAKMNVRELMHFLNLRTGGEAHPSVRRIAWGLHDEITRVHPLIMENVKLKLDKRPRPDKDFPWSI